MPEPSSTIDAVRLEARLATIETKLSDSSMRDRLGSVEGEARSATTSLVRLDERLRAAPGEKEMSDVLQRLARLETRVAHLPSKGFIVTVVTTIGALLAVAISFGKLRSILGF